MIIYSENFKVVFVLAFCLLIQLVTSNSEVNQVGVEEPLKKNDENNDNDYFHESNLSEEEIKKIEEEKRKHELEQKRKQDEELKRIQQENKQPDLIEKIKENEKSNNFNMEKFYMEKIMTEYMKKYQQEQIEKRRLKAKSDLNHPVLSVITLITFFGLGTIIGLIIMFVRSKQFQKSTYKSDKRNNSLQSANNNNKKPIYDKVEQNDQNDQIV